MIQPHSTYLYLLHVHLSLLRVLEDSDILEHLLRLLSRGNIHCLANNYIWIAEVIV